MINKINWEEEINRCETDKSAGIRIAKLTGNKEFSTFITHIEKSKCVNPHYHTRGDEHYHILQGSGEVKLKNMNTKYEQILHVNGGESFIVPENTLHQLTNTGNSTLVLMFSCPDSHLSNDRFFS